MNIKIGSRLVGKNLHPYIIAEIGVNHEGSMPLAKRLIEEAASGGAHAAKFQSYKADKIASKQSPAYWDLKKEPTQSQFALFQKYDAFGPEEYKELSDHCVKVGIDFMSTPFDLEAVDFLDPLMTAFKIASADITNVPLLRKVAQKKKPVLLSTGASTLPEIEFAVQTLRAAGCAELVLLHCVLNYPTPEENAQLGIIPELARIFPSCLIGYSDHVVPDETISALESATLLGACVLEKHFTHDKTLIGNDHYHAMNCEDLKKFIDKLTLYRKLIGDGKKNLAIEDKARIHARRSIFAAVDLNCGDVIDESKIICKRPAHGISPIFWDDVIGKVVTKNIPADMPLLWDCIK